MERFRWRPSTSTRKKGIGSARWRPGDGVEHEVSRRFRPPSAAVFWGRPSPPAWVPAIAVRTPCSGGSVVVKIRSVAPLVRPGAWRKAAGPRERESMFGWTGVLPRSRISRITSCRSLRRATAAARRPRLLPGRTRVRPRCASTANRRNLTARPGRMVCPIQPERRRFASGQET